MANMQIITLNDNPVAYRPAQDATVASVIEAVCHTHMADGHVLGSIVVNGMTIRNEEDGDLGDIGLENIETIAIHTQPPDQAAKQGLAEMGEVVEAVTDHLEASAKGFRFGQMDEALSNFIEGAQLLHDALYFLSLVLDHTGAAKDHPDRLALQGADSELAQALGELGAAQKSGDWSLVADLIEYEIVPRARELDRIGAAA